MLAPTMAATALLILVSASGAAKAGSGLKVSDASTCRFTFQVGFCGGGAPVISATPHTTAGDCCAKCTAHSGCKSWTVNNATTAAAATCYLKAFVPAPSMGHHAAGCTSGTDPYTPPPPPPPAPKGAKNVLFIAVDDLRPELGAYDYKNRPDTPNLDKFATTALTFLNAYTQYSFCCPSRNSFMSGRRPSKTKVWNFIDHFREPEIGGGANPWVSMPGWFKQHGYFVHGMGKLYHPGNPPNDDGELSWSDPSRYSQNGLTPLLPSINSSAGLTIATAAAAVTAASTSANGDHAEPSWETEMLNNGCLTGELGGSYCEINGTQGPDDSLMRAAVTSVAMLANYTNWTQTPFFLGVGFHKPHIPWTIPTRFFTKSIQQTELPLHPGVPSGMPAIAWNRGLGHNALDRYADANRYPLHPNVTFPDDLVRALRRGYRAAVAYLDWMVGNVLDALDASGVAGTTITVFLGDHGYQLGEHNLWCKMTVFELGTRVPFMIRVPGSLSQGKRTTSLVELVDLFPTLVTVAGREAAAPAYLDGTTLATIVNDPTATVKQAAFSEFVKCYSCCKVPDDQPCNAPDNNGPGRHQCTPTDPTDLSEMETCFQVPRENISFVGYSMRTARWRYTEWLHFDGKLLHGDFNRKVATELYDHQADNGNNPDISENSNVADTADPSLLVKLHAMLLAGFPVTPPLPADL